MEFGLGILPENYRAVSLTWGMNPTPRLDQRIGPKPAVRNRTLLYRKLQAGRNRPGMASSPFLPDLAPGGTSTMKSAPRAPPREDKSTALRATTAPQRGTPRLRAGVKGARRGGPE
jgi:hypothetical protein